MTEQDFEYLVPETIEDAVRLRSAHGARAHFISGGTEVVPMMTRGKLREACLIEVSRLPGLTDITGGADGGAIGASVTLTRLRESPVVNRWWMALARPPDRSANRRSGTVARSGAMSRMACLPPISFRRCWCLMPVSSWPARAGAGSCRWPTS